VNTSCIIQMGGILISKTTDEDGFLRASIPPMREKRI